MSRLPDRRRTVRVCLSGADLRMMSQAIFLRSLRYFTQIVRSSSDDLDTFEEASFEIGNEIKFELRRYAREPQHTSTLYLEISVRQVADVVRTTTEIAEALALPRSAIGWKRGDPFRVAVPNATRERLRETEARILCLKIASTYPDRSASTEQIKRKVPELYPLSERDLTPSKTRKREQVWQQIIGNVISHRDTPAGPFAKGYAVRTPNGLRVTDKGYIYLKSLGFAA